MEHHGRGCVDTHIQFYHIHQDLRMRSARAFLNAYGAICCQPRHDHSSMLRHLQFHQCRHLNAYGAICCPPRVGHDPSYSEEARCSEEARSFFLSLFIMGEAHEFNINMWGCAL